MSLKGEHRFSHTTYRAIIWFNWNQFSKKDVVTIGISICSVSIRLEHQLVVSLNILRPQSEITKSRNLNMARNRVNASFMCINEERAAYNRVNMAHLMRVNNMTMHTK